MISTADIERPVSRKTSVARDILRLRLRMWLRRYSKRGAFLKFFGVLAVVLAIPLTGLIFLLSLGLGISMLPQASPNQILMTWGFLCFLFFVFRFTGIVFSMQRDEDLPLQNLLHLPIPLRQVFLLNFVGAQLTVANYMFLPMFLGLAIASSISLNPGNTVWIFTAIAMVLCMGSVVYLLEGWIMATVANKRHRMYVVYGMLMVFVFLAQLPNLYGILEERQQISAPQVVQIQDSGAGTIESSQEKPARLTQERPEEQIRQQDLKAGWVITEDNATGIPLYTLALTASLLLIAGICLFRGYRTTLMRYRKGQSSSQRNITNQRSNGEHSTKRPLIPESIPFAIASATLRQWFRSIHGKMVIFAPFLILIASVVAWLRMPNVLDGSNAPLVVIGFFVLLGAPASLVCNLIAFDGLGFRLFLQAGTSLTRMLFGKCIAISTIFTLMSLITFVLFASLFPISLSHLMATVFQGIAALMVSCVVGIWLSIHFPYAVSHTTMSTTGIGALGLFTFVVHVGVIAFLVLIAWLGLHIEDRLVGAELEIPVYLIYSISECLLIIFCFRPLLNGLADMLQNRSTRILATVGEQS